MIRVFPLAIDPDNEQYLIVTGENCEYVIIDLGLDFEMHERFEMYALDVKGMPWRLVKEEWLLMEGLDGSEFHTGLSQLAVSVEPCTRQ